jgi:ribosomal protein S27E
MESAMRQAAITDRSPHGPPYKRHRPEQTLLYQIIEQHYPAFREVMAAQGKPLPWHVQQEFDDYLKCGRLEHGFLRVQCTECHYEHLVAFSCKRRGFCPSCGARRMAESAALLVDEVFPEQPIRQWVLSFPLQSGCGSSVSCSPVAWN